MIKITSHVTKKGEEEVYIVCCHNRPLDSPVLLLGPVSAYTCLLEIWKCQMVFVVQRRVLHYIFLCNIVAYLFKARTVKPGEIAVAK